MGVSWPFRKQPRTPPVDFARPTDWHNLQGQPGPASHPTQRPQQSQPPQHQPHPQPPPHSPQHRQQPQPPTYTPAPPPPSRKPKLHPLIIVGALLAVAVMASMVLNFPPNTTPTPPPPAPSPFDQTYNNLPRPTQEAPTTWVQTVADLRQGTQGRLESSPHGFSDAEPIIDAGDIWGLITRKERGGENRLHGLDPATGEERWAVDLEGAYCAKDLLNEHFVCAEATEWTSGQGTSWTLHLIDPRTGETTTSAPFDGWVAAVAVADGHLVILEQRLPAPHAVVTALDSTFTQAWQFDLTQEPGHDDMFSENRVWYRAERFPEGPALDRPRIRTVAGGLTALWVGQRTVFLDVAGGRMAGFLHCSRLVDDGERLWCNAGNHAVAYDYELQPLFTTADGVRLAFPLGDRRASDISIPAFLGRDGALMRVNPTTGETEGVLVATQSGSAFGMATAPSVATVDGVLLASDDRRSAAVSADGEVRWQVDFRLSMREAFAVDGSVLVGDSTIHQIDLATGEVIDGWRVVHGHGFAATSDAFYSYGLEEVARLGLG